MHDPSRARVTGPLQPYAAGFIEELSRLGYTTQSACGQVLLLAHVSRWLAGEGLDAGALTPEAADRFLAARRAAGYVLYLSPKALVPLLGFLRRIGVVPEAPPPVEAPEDALLGRYRHYLMTERGLAAETAADYACKGQAVPGRPRWSRPGGPDGGRGDRVHRGDVPFDAEGHGEADGDRTAVTAGLAARGRRDPCPAGLGGSRGRVLAAGRAAGPAGAGPGPGDAGRLRHRDSTLGCGTWRW